MSQPVFRADSANPGLRGRRVILVAVVAGLALRLANYGAFRSLWVDEASLALNIAGRSYLQLLLPLDYNQTAPILFLWLERLAIDLGGVNEWSLRLLPLLSGLATLVLIPRLASRVMPPPAAALGTVIAAFSPALIVYSVELKPYALDGLVGVVLTLLALAVAHHPDSVRAWTRLLVGGAVSLLASTTAPFVLAGIMLALMIARPVRDSVAARWWYAATSVVTGAIFLALYQGFYSAAVDTAGYMQTVWQSNFLTPGSPGFLAHTWAALREMIWASVLGGVTNWGLSGARVVLINGGTLILLCCAAIGLHAVRRNRGTVFAALLVGPGVMVLVASALQLYPISLRLVLFTVPSLILIIAAGVYRLMSALPAHLRGRVLVVVASLLAVRAAAYDLISLVVPSRAEQGREVIRELERHHRSGEPVYIYSRGLGVWAFYTTDWSAPDRRRLSWFHVQGGLHGPAFENASGRGRPVSSEEGKDLVYVYRGRAEILGLSTGVKWRALAGFSQPGPDPGWAAREAVRIKEAAHPTAWLFVTHVVDLSHEMLLESLGNLGATVVYRHVLWGAGVFQVRFD